MTADTFKCPVSALPRWWDIILNAGQSSVYCLSFSHDRKRKKVETFAKFVLVFFVLFIFVFSFSTHSPHTLCSVQVLGFLLASFGFVEFFYILLERSQDIQHHMVFLLSPIIRSMTVVNTVALFSHTCTHLSKSNSSCFDLMFYWPGKGYAHFRTCMTFGTSRIGARRVYQFLI